MGGASRSDVADTVRLCQYRKATYQYRKATYQYRKVTRGWPGVLSWARKHVCMFLAPVFLAPALVKPVRAEEKEEKTEEDGGRVL